MNISLKRIIIDYVADKGWIFGGQIEDYIRDSEGAKGATTSRRCRELERAGVLLKRIVPMGRVRVVQYLLNPDIGYEKAKTQKTEVTQEPLGLSLGFTK